MIIQKPVGFSDAALPHKDLPLWLYRKIGRVSISFDGKYCYIIMTQMSN